MGILGQLLYAVAPYLGVPQGIDKSVLIPHGCGEVNHLDLVVVVGSRVLPDNPAPGVAARLVVSGRLVKWLYDIVRDGGLDNGLEGIAYGDGAPGGVTFGQGDDRMAAALAFHLTGIGEGDGVALARLVVAEVRSDILAGGACLADKYPAVITDVEQTGERVTLAKSGRLGNWGIGSVLLLIGRLGLCKSHHGLALRTDEAGSLLGEVEASGLLLDNGIATELALAFQQGVAESDIIVGYEESYRHGQTFLVLEAQVELVGNEVRRGGLGARHVVGAVHTALLAVLQGQPLGEIANVGFQSEGGGSHHALSVVIDTVTGLSFLTDDAHLQLPVG